MRMAQEVLCWALTWAALLLSTGAEGRKSYGFGDRQLWLYMLKCGLATD